MERWIDGGQKGREDRGMARGEVYRGVFGASQADALRINGVTSLLECSADSQDPPSLSDRCTTDTKKKIMRMKDENSKGGK